MSSPEHPTDSARGVSKPLLASLIDRHNPGVTMLLVIWIAGFELRHWLEGAGVLSSLVDEALLSLIYVVPIMLVGWGVLALIDRPGRRFLR
jgi:hypothetical protein